MWLVQPIVGPPLEPTWTLFSFFVSQLIECSSSTNISHDWSTCFGCNRCCIRSHAIKHQPIFNFWFWQLALLLVDHIFWITRGADDLGRKQFWWVCTIPVCCFYFQWLQYNKMISLRHLAHHAKFCRLGYFHSRCPGSPLQTAVSSNIFCLENLLFLQQSNIQAPWLCFLVDCQGMISALAGLFWQSLPL